MRKCIWGNNISFNIRQPQEQTRCDACGKLVAADGFVMDNRKEGITLCLRCAKRAGGRAEGERPVLEFSRETFVKLP